MVALFLVAGEICVGLFKTFFQLGEGSTFVQLVCICAVLNGHQIRGAGEISLPRCWRRCSWTAWLGLMPRLRFWRRLWIRWRKESCTTVEMSGGGLGYRSALDEGSRLMGSVCGSEHVFAHQSALHVHAVKWPLCWFPLIAALRRGGFKRALAWSSIMESTVNAKQGHPETDWIETSSLKVVCSEIHFLSLMFSLLLLVLYIDCPPQGQNKPRVQTLSLVKLM